MLSRQLLEAVKSSVEYDMPEREELIQLWMTYKKHKAPISRKSAERLADGILKRANDPRTVEKVKKSLEQARKQYTREVAAGKKYADLLTRVAPNPSRDDKPFLDSFRNAKSVDEINLITTGQKIPFAFWKPFPPIELVVYLHEKDPKTGKQLVSIEDGNHRLRTARQVGATEIRTQILWRDEDGSTKKKIIVVLPL